MVARLAWRSIWRHRRRTAITVASIAFGLAFMIFSVSVAEGVYARLVDDAVRLEAGHVTLEHPAYRDAPAVDLRVAHVNALRARLAALPDVEATRLVALGQGVARSGTAAAGVAIVGIEPRVEVRTSPLPPHMVAGRYLTEDDGARVVVGSLLAERLGLGVGKKLVLTTNDVHGALVEGLFRVAGIFRTGADEVDGYLVQAPLGAVRGLFGLGPDEATRVGVLLRDPDAERAALAHVHALLDGAPVAVRRWQEVLPELAAFMRLDRTSDWTFQGMLLLLVLFTIFNTILMSVLERRREFAVLQALGTDARQLRLQVLFESAYIGLLGTAGGLLVGGTLAAIVQVHGWDVSGFYPEGMVVSGLAVSTRLHAKVTARILLALGGVVFTAAVLAGVPPMRHAARGSIADVLR